MVGKKAFSFCSVSITRKIYVGLLKQKGEIAP